MERIFISKIKEYENGEVFGFRYEGIPNNTYDAEKVEKIVAAFLNRCEIHRDMAKNVVYLRTILKDTEEKLLVVQYESHDNEKTVKYDNGNLFLFQCKVKDNNENHMEVEYSPRDGLKTSFWNSEDKDILAYPQSKTLEEKFSKIIDGIATLKRVDCIHLDDDLKTLIEIYKLFYNENPDFTKEDIQIKVQSMLSILVQFNIYFDNYRFEFTGQMPESLKIFMMVDDGLFPFGEVTTVKEPIELRESAKKIIKIIGEMIRETIGNDVNMNEALITISKTIYASKYAVEYVDDIQTLVEYPNINLTYDEAKSSVQLVKKISKKLEEMN